MAALDEFLEKLKKEHKIPSDVQFIKELTREHNGKMVAFRATIGETAIKLSPPIILVDEFEGEEYSTGFTTLMLDIKVRFENSYLYVGFEKGAKQQNVLDFFNNAMALFNIVYIPFDFVSVSDLIVKMKGLGREIEALWSSKAHHRGYGLEPLKIKMKDFVHIVVAIWILWSKIKKSEYFKEDNYYQLLGYGAYYNFHDNHFLSFTHSWLFIESSINMMWTKMVNDAFPQEPQVVSKEKWDDCCGPPTNYERNWTTQIKIDELYLRGMISEELREELHELRNKRNKVLHQERKKKERIVDATDAIKAFKVGLSIFYKMIDFGQPDKIIAFLEIRKQMYQTVNRGRLYRTDEKAEQ
jgi:hypothetical protein